MKSLLSCLAALAVLGAALPLRAHDPGLSTAVLSPGADKIGVQLVFAPADLAALQLTPEVVATRAVAWSAEGTALPVRVVAVRADAAAVEFDLEVPRTAGTFQSLLLAELPLGHRQLLTLRDAAGTTLRTRMLSAAVSAEVITAEDLAKTAPTETATSFGGFFRLGIEHILAGYDHLLFLLGILIVCTRLGPAVKIITCFTLAHSFTLAAVTLGWFHLPGHIVEPLIAASILYIGLENVFLTQTVRRRCVLTFGFGLIHGMGFAGALAELGVGQDGRGILGPLVGFNLGVETGQIAVAIVVLPVLLALRRQPAFLARGVPGLSVLIALAGGYWLVARTLL